MRVQVHFAQHLGRRNEVFGINLTWPTKLDPPRLGVLAEQKEPARRPALQEINLKRNILRLRSQESIQKI